MLASLRILQPHNHGDSYNEFKGNKDPQNPQLTLSQKQISHPSPKAKFPACKSQNSHMSTAIPHPHLWGNFVKNASWFWVHQDHIFHSSPKATGSPSHQPKISSSAVNE